MRALVLGSNATLILSVVWALGDAGIEADVISDWHAPRVRYSRYCRRYTRVPLGSLRVSQPNFVIKLVDYCTRHAIDLVIPADLTCTLELAALPAGDLTRFPLASRALLETLHDKWHFHQLLSRLGLPSPETRILDARQIASASELNYPLLVKPVIGEGGEGIVRCDSARELTRRWAEIERTPQRWLAQELIPGHDIDLSLLADHGRIVAHTIQRDEGEGAKRLLQDERLLPVASEIVRATEFHGLAHFDMRVDDRTGRLYVIECNPRVWGSLMYSVWAGVNFVALGCRVAKGEYVETCVAANEHVWHQGVAPRRLLGALLHGRTSPVGMTGATLASWKQVHRDAWTQLIGGFTEPREERLRKRFTAHAQVALDVRR